MKTNIVIGAAATVVVVVLAALFLHVPAVSAPALQDMLSAASSTPQTHTASSSQPTFHYGTPVKIKAVAAFDTHTFISSSTYPTVTGTANIPKVGVIMYDAKGVGISGTSAIPVTSGHWTYTASVALTPGTYLLVLFGGDAADNATLTVGAR